jgi:hypothetical protein
MILIDRLRHYITRRHLQPPLGFVHIPKAGGTAMVQQLDARLRPRKFVYGLDRSQFGSFSAFETMSPSMRGGIFLESNAIPADTDIIAGHISPTIIRERFENAHLVTVLRAPESRLLSQWVYWRGYDDNVLAEFGEWGRSIAGARCDLADFLQMKNLACVTDNLILRMLLWPHPLIPADNFINPSFDDTLLHDAMLVLNSFSYINIMEAPKQNERLAYWLFNIYGLSFWSKLSARISETRPSNTNEAKAPILKTKTRLSDQISGLAGTLMRDRNRLDSLLWNSVAKKNFPGVNPAELSESLFFSNVNRYEKLDNLL